MSMILPRKLHQLTQEHGAAQLELAQTRSTTNWFLLKQRHSQQQPGSNMAQFEPAQVVRFYVTRGLA